MPPRGQGQTHREPAPVLDHVADHDSDGMRPAQLLARDPDLVEARPVRLQPMPQRGDAGGLWLGQSGGAAGDVLPPRERLRRLPPSRGGLAPALGLLPPRRLQHLEQVKRVLVLGLDDLRPNGLGEARGERADGAFRRLPRHLDEVGSHDRLADVHQHRRRAERPGIVEDEADGEQRHAAARAAPVRSGRRRG